MKYYRRITVEFDTICLHPYQADDLEDKMCAALSDAAHVVLMDSGYDGKYSISSESIENVEEPK